MFDKLPVFIADHPLLIGLALVAIICTLVLEIRKGGRPVTVSRLTAMINDNQATVVDIRPDKEFKAGHINGSINIPQDKILGQTNLLNKAGKTPVLVCSSGMQCRTTAEKLEESGVMATRLSGGIGEWTASGIPLVK